MAKRLIPFLNRVLIEKIVPPSKTTAGILLPESSSKLNSGKVVAVGPGTRDKSGNTVPVGVKEGDTVLLPEYGGTEVKLGDKHFKYLSHPRLQRALHTLVDQSRSVNNFKGIIIFVVFFFSSPTATCI